MDDSDEEPVTADALERLGKVTDSEQSEEEEEDVEDLDMDSELGRKSASRPTKRQRGDGAAEARDGAAAPAAAAPPTKRARAAGPMLSAAQKKEVAEALRKYLGRKPLTVKDISKNLRKTSTFKGTFKALGKDQQEHFWQCVQDWVELHTVPVKIVGKPHRKLKDDTG